LLENVSIDADENRNINTEILCSIIDQIEKSDPKNCQSALAINAQAIPREIINDIILKIESSEKILTCGDCSTLGINLYTIFNNNDLTFSKALAVLPDEVPCCRVCHGESEPDNQLFYPCKCDGSIKYVHQQCLLEWLKVKKQQQRVSQPRCELCGELFIFQNIYSPDAPVHLTYVDIALELLPRVLGVAVLVAKGAVFLLCWGALLPLFANGWVKLCWCAISEGVEVRQWDCLASAMPPWTSLEGIAFAWYNGIVNLCIVIGVSVMIFELGQMIHRVS
jgi:hypothetical protein